MISFWKGKNMMDKKEPCEKCCCECCQCKKLFMMAVILLLVFMAGIMVGNCRNYHPISDYYTMLNKTNKTNAKLRKHHRGMHEIQPTKQHNATIRKNTEDAGGGFIVEIDQGE